MKRFLLRALMVVGIFILVMVVITTTYGTYLKRAAAKLVIPPLNLANVADGTYTGTAVVAHVRPKVSVAVAGGRITSISFVTPVAGDGVGLVDRIVAAQSLDVDDITGATISTRTVLAAVGNALTQ
jgi:uncharacterized protein with FMN-binding domain